MPTLLWMGTLLVVCTTVVIAMKLSERYLSARAQRQLARVFVGVGVLMFVALVITIGTHLSDDYTPAQHLGIDVSAYFVDPSGRTRLLLVVRGVALDGTPRATVLPPASPGGDPVVELRSATRPDTAPEHDGSVTLDLVVPRGTHLTVIDRRWGHDDHPQGYRFPLREQPPEGWKPADRP